MPKWLIVLLCLVAVLACIGEVRQAVMKWFKKHPALTRPALILAAAAIVLYILINPITILFLILLAIAAGFSAFLDPKTYTKKKLRD